MTDMVMAHTEKQIGSGAPNEGFREKRTQHPELLGPRSHLGVEGRLGEPARISHDCCSNCQGQADHVHTQDQNEIDRVLGALFTLLAVEPAENRSGQAQAGPTRRNRRT